MTQHVVIRRESYVAGSKQRPEVGIFTQTHATRPPVPWNKIAVGDDVWMKWSGGPVVAKARVRGFLQIETCTAAQLREKTSGHKLHDLDSYWSSLPPVFFALVVWLEREEWLEEVLVPRARSRGESWVVLNTAKLRAGWLSAAPKPATAAKAKSRTLPQSVRFAVLRRDGFRCRYCGSRPPEARLTVDHVKAWSADPSHALENLVTACVPCNSGKGARSLEERAG